MTPSAARLLMLLAAGGFAACADVRTPDTPLAPSDAHGAALSAEAGETRTTWLVRFGGGGVPLGFTERVAALGGTVVFAHDRAMIGAVAGLSPRAAAELVRSPGVRAVTADEVTVLESTRGEVAAPDLASLDLANQDPASAWGFPRQWHLRAIGAHDAWAAGRTGSPAVKVAILDTGLDYRHPDLAGRVDLASSRSFRPAQDALVEAHFPGAHPVADLHYHGTHVGATVASNAVIAAGVTSQAALVGMKVCNLDGTCPVSAMLAAVVHAADLGVDVVNISVGNRFLRRDSAAAHRDGPSFVAVVTEAFNYAHRMGVTVVVAAGNQATDLDHDGDSFRTYCGAPTVICVSGTGPRAAGGVNGPWTDVDAPAWYTNYGRSAVTVAAPGGAAQPVWAACSTFSILVPVCQTGVFVVGLNGTSMATPHAAGVAALIVEDVGRDPARVRTRLQQTADDLGESGTDPFYGRGRINAARAAGAM